MPDTTRASDADREAAVVSLREHLLSGRLTLEEFTERVELAYTAKVGTDLERIQADLPAHGGGTGPPARRPTRLTAALLAHVVRRGRLRLRGWTVTASAFSDIDLDLRDAQIDAARTTVTVLTLLGNTDVYVPEGVNVEVGGLAVLGHRRDWGRDIARRDAPTIRVRALGLAGTIDVWRVPAQVTGSYGEIMRGVRDAPRELEP